MIGYKYNNINGKVLDKYLINQNSIGVIVKDDYGKKYSIEFNTKNNKAGFSNLYGLLNDSFQNKNIENLIQAGDYIGVNVNRSQNPIKSVYKLNYVSSKPVTLTDRKEYYLI